MFYGSVRDARWRLRHRLEMVNITDSEYLEAITEPLINHLKERAADLMDGAAARAGHPTAGTRHSFDSIDDRRVHVGREGPGLAFSEWFREQLSPPRRNSPRRGAPRTRPRRRDCATRSI